MGKRLYMLVIVLVTAIIIVGCGSVQIKQGAGDDYLWVINIKDGDVEEEFVGEYYVTGTYEGSSITYVKIYGADYKLIAEKQGEGLVVSVNKEVANK